MEFQNLIEKRRSVRKYVERNTVTKDENFEYDKSSSGGAFMEELSNRTLLLYYGRKECGTVQTGMSAGNECREM